MNVENKILNGVRTQELIDEIKNRLQSVRTLVSTDPYTFRQSKGNLADIEIEGASVAWNQLMQNGNFASSSGWQSDSASLSIANNEAVVTFTGSAWNNDLRRYITIPANHVVMFSAMVKSSLGLSNNHLTFGITYGGGGAQNSSNINYSNNYTRAYRVIKTNNTSVTARLSLKENGSALSGESFNVKEFNVFDLTVMFGSTIADAIYAMEQASEGAGVAFFRKYFPKDYYAYDAGSIQSVCIGSRKAAQFYNFDHSNILNAYINESTGTIASSSTGSKTVYFYAPRGEYRITKKSSSTFRIALYENMPVVGSTIVSDSMVKLTLQKECIYTTSRDGWIAIFCVHSASAYDLENAQRIIDSIEVHKTVATYPFDSTKELRGMFDFVNGELKANGDIYTADGNIQKKYGIVDLGTLDWKYYSSKQYFYSTLSNAKVPSSGSIAGNIVCAKYPNVPNTSPFPDAIDKVICLTQNGQLEIKDTSYNTDAETLDRKSVV